MRSARRSRRTHRPRPDLAPGLPTIYVLDGDGVIRYVGHSDTKLDELVDDLVGKLEKK